MLQNLREHVQGWIAGVIAGILCLAFALWGVEYYIGGNTSHSVVAKVNGFSITQDQWDTAYNRARQSQQIQFDDPQSNEAYKNQLKQQVLNGLMQAHVLSEAAKKAGYIISSAQIGAVLRQIPAFQLEGHFSYPLFQRALENLSYTLEGFTQEISNSSLLTQVQRSLTETNFALPNDLDRDTSLQNQKRSFGYVMISSAPFLATASVTKQAVEDYYKTNIQNFMLPEQLSLQYLVISTEEANKKITLTEQELTQYYQENKASFTGANNAKTASTFAAVKPSIEKTLRQQKVEQWIATQTDKLSNLVYTHPDTLKDAADALDLPLQTTAFFTRSGEKKENDKTGLLSNPKVLAAAFSENVLKQHNNSEVITVDDHTAVVLRVSGYKPATTDPLVHVEQKIEMLLKQEAAYQAAAALGEQIQEAIKKGASPSQLAMQHKLNWVEKNNVSRTTKEVLPEILDIAFNQPAPESNKIPSVEGKKLADHTYAVVVLNTIITAPSAPLDASAQQSLQKQLENNFGGLDAELYLADLMNNAKIKIETETGAKQ